VTVHILHETPPLPLAAALAEFERQFVYPLGPGRTFRIDHGSDYPRFYRAIGDGRCYVDEREGRVLGVGAAALRPVQCADGRLLTAAYIGDLKAAPGPGRGKVLQRITQTAQSWCFSQGRAFGVVMDGTPVVPTAYTGRIGIPRFVEVAKIVVWRFKCAGIRSAPGEQAMWATEETARATFSRLSFERIAIPPGTPWQRSAMPVTWLVLVNGQACGCLEDTRLAKRLIADDGKEMVSAHLSNFGYRDMAAGAALVRQALVRANREGYPALFVAVAAPEADALQAELSDIEAVRAPATVFAHGFEPGLLWNVNSSEI
jgi:hypothetical protein